MSRKHGLQSMPDAHDLEGVINLFFEDLNPALLERFAISPEEHDAFVKRCREPVPHFLAAWDQFRALGEAEWEVWMRFLTILTAAQLMTGDVPN